MNHQTILIISLTSYVTSLRAESLCYRSGKTWSSFGQIALIPEVSSVQACIKFCREYDNCNGYTWLGITNQRLSNVCVLFKDLDLEHECKNCISVKMSDLERAAANIPGQDPLSLDVPRDKMALYLLFSEFFFF